MRIRFGSRSFRTKTYPLEHFKISKEEAEQYSVQYNGFDIWNFNKEEKVSNSRIEKRTRYFHILYIPFFPLKVEWTIRKTDGLLYRVNEKCEKKIMSVYRKAKSPWYSYLGILFILIAMFIGYYNAALKWDLRSRKYDKTYLKENYAKNFDLFQEIEETTYISFVSGYNYIDPDYYNKKAYARVIKVDDNKVLLGYLPSKADTFRYYHSPYIAQFVFEENQDRLSENWINKEELLDKIPSKLSNLKNTEDQFICEIFNYGYINEPIIDVINYSYNKFSFKNNGKPVYLIDIENKDKDVCNWKVELPILLDTKRSKSKESMVIEAEVLNDQKFTKLNTVFIFTDNENNIFEFEILKDNSLSKFKVLPIKK